MQMKNPCHPGKIVKDAITNLGWSLRKAARSLDISRNKLLAIMNGKACITEEIAVKLEKSIGSSAAAWMGMQHNYDSAHREDEEES